MSYCIRHFLRDMSDLQLTPTLPERRQSQLNAYNYKTSNIQILWTYTVLYCSKPEYRQRIFAKSMLTYFKISVHQILNAIDTFLNYIPFDNIFKSFGFPISQFTLCLKPKQKKVKRFFVNTISIVATFGRGHNIFSLSSQLS